MQCRRTFVSFLMRSSELVTRRMCVPAFREQMSREVGQIKPWERNLQKTAPATLESFLGRPLTFMLRLKGSEPVERFCLPSHLPGAALPSSSAHFRCHNSRARLWLEKAKPSQPVAAFHMVRSCPQRPGDFIYQMRGVRERSWLSGVSPVVFWGQLCPRAG